MNMHPTTLASTFKWPLRWRDEQTDREKDRQKERGTDGETTRWNEGEEGQNDRLMDGQIDK